VELDKPPNLQFGDVEVILSQSVKVLGVTLDIRLVMDEYISGVMIKAFKAYTALQTIKGVRPKQIR
jgi:hypothetical protein